MPDDRQPNESLLRDIACPFCGLCCDDLTVRRDGANLELVDNSCTRAARGIDSPCAPGDAGVRVLGEPGSAEDAVAHAATLLSNARLPLFAGLGTDVAGARALLQLADRCGASFDHMNSEAMLRNLLAVQDSGWMTTTLTEVRNRADVMLVFAGSLERHAPRFYERIFSTETESLFSPGRPDRELIVIGDCPPPPVDAHVRTRLLNCPNDRLGEVAMALRALLHGAPLAGHEVAGIPLEALRAVVDKLQKARYGVVAWAAAELPFAHAELAVQAFCELARELNRSTRCSALPLGGDNGDHTFAQVATWQTGYATRASLAAGHPEFDPLRYQGTRMLEDGEADVLLWVSAFDERRTPPDTTVPTIVLGRAGMQLRGTPDVYIPVATPGVDHPGHVYRCDTVATLPLRGLRTSPLPAVADIALALLDSL